MTIADLLLPRGGADDLLSAHAVKHKAAQMLALAEAGGLQGWHFNRSRLEATADLVLATIRANYPTLDIPFHARWRHFTVAEEDRAAAYRQHEGRVAYDLIMVSVLLDAGAGPHWSYRTRDGHVMSRSEGLAVASLEMFEAGVFSADPADPLRADAARLQALTADDLARGMQVSESNPLAGLEGRAALLNRLGEAISQYPAIYGTSPRPGGLFDALKAHAVTKSLAAPDLLRVILKTLGSIWPDRPVLEGVMLGDTWAYAPLHSADPTAHLVPFHKLSQWLTYSLIEPLQWAGIAVSGVDDLTGLPEYRNGGLFMDMGVLTPKDPADTTRAHAPDSILIVEWRAMTVALLAEIAVILRERLAMDAESLPQAKVLEGGTWAAGRQIAAKLREGGGPPLNIVSDGTVF